MTDVEEFHGNHNQKTHGYRGGSKLRQLKQRFSKKAQANIAEKVKADALSTAVGTRIRASKVSRGVATQIVKVENGTAYSKSGRAFKPTGETVKANTGSIGDLFVWKDAKTGGELYSPTLRPRP